jgi:putative molybdopterin biosynthesis protein
MDVGLTILAGQADAGPCIQPVAELLGLDFLPWRWERYDLLIDKAYFFSLPVQHFLGLLHEKPFVTLASKFKGYDLSASGRMLFPQVPQKIEVP